jgi:hypothetical protein
MSKNNDNDSFGVGNDIVKQDPVYVDNFHVNTKKDILSLCISEESMKSEKGRALRSELKELVQTEGRQAANIVLHGAVLDCISRGMSINAIRKELGISATHAKKLVVEVKQHITTSYSNTNGNDMLGELMGGAEALKLLNSNILHKELNSFIEAKDNPMKVMLLAQEMQAAGFDDKQIEMWFRSRLDTKLITATLKNLDSIDKQKAAIASDAGIFEISPVNLRADSKSARDRAKEALAKLEDYD